MLLTVFTVTLSLLTLMPRLCYSYDSSLGLNERCKGQCDKHRKLGDRGEYQVDCEKEYPDKDSQDDCSGKCLFCPESICQSLRPNIFKCPETDIEGQCKMNCDLNREKGSLDAYILKCDEAYQSYSDIQECRNQCKDCPKWVCDPREDSNKYYCPTGRYDGDCKVDCEYHRRTRFQGTKDKFTFHCTDFQSLGTDAVEDCYKSCFNCPLMICNEFDDRNEYTCPPNPKSITVPTTTTEVSKTTPTTEKTYKGRCTEFCDRFRNGGTDEYQLTCGSVFNTIEEILECKAICNGCPDICSDWYRFKCPAADNHFDHKTAFIVCLVLVIVLAVGLAVAVIIIICRNSNPGVGVIAQPGVVAPVNSQVQQSTHQLASYKATPQATQSALASYQYQPSVPA